VLGYSVLTTLPPAWGWECIYKGPDDPFAQGGLAKRMISSPGCIGMTLMISKTYCRCGNVWQYGMTVPQISVGVLVGYQEIKQDRQ
jgi:hypothetical protein